MDRVKGFTVLICVVAASVAAAGAAQAQPVALVLERTGMSVPALPPYSEIPANTTVSLSAGARLVFLHYYTCRTVAVIGGVIAFSPETFRITGGTKESDQRTPCPREVRLTPGGEFAGTVVRSGPAGTLTLSPAPMFVLVGQRAGDFASARVLQGDKELLEAPLADRQFRWPPEAPPLAVDAEYELALVPAVAGAVPVSLRFRTVAPSPHPTGEALVLITVE